MLATYLIGLREGLEAALVVSILAAFLVKSGRREHLGPMWLGVGLAVALSVGFSAVLTYTSTTVLSDFRQREAFEAITSLAAVVFVTWMIFWMRRAARSIGGELRARLGEAIMVGWFAVAGVAFLAVVREGLETALLFFSAVQGATTAVGPLLALLGGLATAVVLGGLLYASAIRINLTLFFTWTGALLALVAAGILKYSAHDFQEAAILPGIGAKAFDISGVLDPDSWYGTLLAGMLNITPNPTVLEVVVWVGYAVPVLILFLRRGRKAPAPPQPTMPAAVGSR